MEYLRPLIEKGDIKVVLEQAIDNWDPKNAHKLMKQALAMSNNKIDAVLAPNDATAGGVIEALSSQGLAGKIPVTGQDAQKDAAVRIEKGLQSMTVFKDTRILGEAAIDAAILLAKGMLPETKGKTINNGTNEVNSLLLTPIEVTKENIDDVLVKSGYMKKSDIHN